VSTPGLLRNRIGGSSAPSAYERLIDDLRNNGQLVNEGHSKAMAQCPAHDDTNPSLSLTAIEGRVLVYCHAGCRTETVMAVLGRSLADLYDNRSGADYRYHDDRIVHRTPNKRFSQSGNTHGNALFHVERITDAPSVFVVEGEQDVLAVEAAGGAAVSSAGGAMKAHLADWSPLADRNVVIVRDKDKPGHKHAAQVAELLKGTAASVRIVEAATGKDAADHIAAGHGLDDFLDVPSAAAADGMPTVWRATDLKPAEQPRWLAKSRLPYGAASILIGDEGIGKSLLWVWIGAAVSKGEALPAFGIPARDPGLVFIVITEDGWQDNVLPRLEVAGADLSMVRVICTENDGSGSPIFPRDLHLIREADPPPALIVVDAWLDTVSAAMSVRDAQQARQALHPWKDVATVTGAAVLLLCHTNRVASADARDRYGATSELRKKARMTLYAQQDEDGRLLVGPEKSNTAVPVPASTFTITAVQRFEPTEDHDGSVPLLTYFGDSDLTAREHIAQAYAASHEPDGNADVLAWLAAELAAGPRWAADVQTAAEIAGYSTAKLKRAKRTLHVQSARETSTGPWFWKLAHHQGTP
jgi:5S rRNA maturation endonuclease (ribonuclease M5)